MHDWSHRPLTCAQSSRQCVLTAKPAGSAVPQTVARAMSFLRWMVGELAMSICPSSVSDRKSMALELWKEFCAVFFATQTFATKQSKTWHAEYEFDLPFVFTAANTQALIIAAVDSYDKIRILSCDILQYIPGHVFPGFAEAAQVVELVRWTTGACPYNRPCAHQYVGKSQSCMVIKGRLIVHAPVQV